MSGEDEHTCSPVRVVSALANDVETFQCYMGSDIPEALRSRAGQSGGTRQRNGFSLEHMGVGVRLGGWRQSSKEREGTSSVSVDSIVRG